MATIQKTVTSIVEALAKDAKSALGQAVVGAALSAKAEVTSDIADLKARVEALEAKFAPKPD